MKTIPSTQAEHQLTQVADCFDAWRQTRTTRAAPIPVRPKNWNALQSQRFGPPAACLPASLPPPDVSYSFLMASNHFWGSTEIDENVSLTLL
jgi:hypothetical protein